MFCCLYFVFFFKQKTAYEMRISDWSSDVCSSDLGKPFAEITSIGCHTNLWHFRNMEYHHWVKREGLLEKFPEIAPSDMVVQPAARSEERRVGKECVSTCSSRGSRDH